MQDFYEENYKTLLRDLKEIKEMEEFTTFMDWKTILLRCQFSLNWLIIPHNSNQNLKQVFVCWFVLFWCATWQVNSKTYMEMQRAENSQVILEGEWERKTLSDIKIGYWVSVLHGQRDIRRLVEWEKAQSSLCIYRH